MKRVFRVVFFAAVLGLVFSSGTVSANDLTFTPMEMLGKNLFFDKISDPDWVSCASCHDPKVGWTGPVGGINRHGTVYRGAVPQRFGNRKPPSSAYATLSPVFHYAGEGLFVGGNFWDGRATGERLGNPAADQALGPFLNPVEQNNPSKKAVLEQIAKSKYVGLWEIVYGEPLSYETDEEVDENYSRVGLAIAAYEASSEVNQFSSRYDAWLSSGEGLTEQELWGLELFHLPNNNDGVLEEGEGGNCAACHPTGVASPLLTDFTYDNVGTPRNPENPFYNMDEVFLDDGTAINPQGRDWIDPGLGGFLEMRPEWEELAEENMGKHKVPTLRNVDKREDYDFPKAYAHNGYFKSLKSIVHFYNTRDAKPPCPDPFTTEKDALRMNCWPAPEVPANLNTDELGNLGLSPEEEDAIVAFLKTLSDRIEVEKKAK